METLRKMKAENAVCNACAKTSYDRHEIMSACVYLCMYLNSFMLRTGMIYDKWNQYELIIY